MLNTNQPGKSFLNRQEYINKVRGCWAGKAIGGTLGAPMEWTHDILDVSFYTQELTGTPAPNDDLDLQLVFLKAIEEHGPEKLNERILGEYWLNFITGPWNEYGIARSNMLRGLPPPLSGSVGNRQWQNSNGAWIRSEIWACLFPGDPDRASRLFWCDSVLDHCDDGVYAEMFVGCMECAAFLMQDIRQIIQLALQRIPKDCRIAKSVQLVLDGYDRGDDWKDVRNALVEQSADIGWFQAPANVGFIVLALLWGEDDFAKTITAAVNCGDDTDCTGATCGALWGIIHGYDAIPKRWLEPIGEGIVTIAIDPMYADTPKTLTELTARVVRCKESLDHRDICGIRLHDDLPTTIAPEQLQQLTDPTESQRRLARMSFMRMRCPVNFGEFYVEFANSPEMDEGECQELEISFGRHPAKGEALLVDWELPEGWSIAQGKQQCLPVSAGGIAGGKITLIAGPFQGAFQHIRVRLQLSGRFYPEYVVVPIIRKGAVLNSTGRPDQDFWDRANCAIAAGTPLY